MIATRKLYYENNKLSEFEARVLSVEKVDKIYHLIVDQTAFYPEGGGQSADKGTLASIPVLDVQKHDDVIVHHLTEKPAEETVTGIVDWQFRFHAMQQHSGQHIISAVFWHAFQARTFSVHLGQYYTTVEFEVPGLTDMDISMCEERINEIVCSNIPITTVFPQADELSHFSLRKPCTHSQNIRLVQIGDFDCVACGGVHCSSTGEVGLIKAVASEKIRGNIRIQWKIGRDAYQDYDLKNKIIAGLRTELNTNDSDILVKLGQINQELVTAQREQHRLEQRLAHVLAESLYSDREPAPDLPFDWIMVCFNQEDDQLIREIAKDLVNRPGPLAVCLTNRSKNRYSWLIGCSETVDLPFSQLHKDLFARTQAKGGGRPPIWQGIGHNPSLAEEFGHVLKSILVTYFTPK